MVAEALTCDASQEREPVLVCQGEILNAGQGEPCDRLLVLALIEIEMECYELHLVALRHWRSLKNRSGLLWIGRPRQMIEGSLFIVERHVWRQ